MNIRFKSRFLAMLVVVETYVAGGESAPGWFARVSWQAKLAGIVVLAYVVMLFTLYLRLKHLPGPYYGGDLYAHHGFALNYIANGFWSDPYFVGHYSFYPWLGNYLFIFLSVLPGVSLMQAENFVGILTTILSAFAFWLLGMQVFKNRTWALVLVLLSLATRGIPSGAPNLVPWMITIPFWFAFWLKAEETKLLRDKLLAGLFIGLTSLSHVAFFLSGISIFFFTIIIEILLKPNKKQAISDGIKLYGPMVLTGFLVSLLFYGPIIVNYQAKSLNPLFEYNGPAVETLGIGWALKTILNTTFNFGSVLLSILTVLTVLGLLLCIVNFGKKQPRHVLLWYVAGALVPLHHLVTRPLLGRWVLPGHLWGIALPMLIFAVYGIRAITQHAESRWPQANVPRVMLVLVLLFGAVFTVHYYNEYRNDRWTQFGEKLEPMTQAWLAVGDWARNNTDINTVFLAHDETCFAINGVSGRKCVFVRRTHANYFVDVEQRYADGAVIFYGNNKLVTQKLLQDYDVDYVMLDAVMMQQPFLVDAKFEDYLRQNNVSFSKVQARKDPADANARVFELLAVPMQSLNKELESRLSESAVFNVNGQPVLRVFEVNRE